MSSQVYFCVFLTPTGEILRLGTAPLDQVPFQNSVGTNEVGSSGDEFRPISDLTHYIDYNLGPPGIPTLKSTIPIVIDKTTVKSDGVDTINVTGLPTNSSTPVSEIGTVIRVVGPSVDTTTTTTTGAASLTFSGPGSFTLTFTPGPRYLPVTQVINAVNTAVITGVKGTGAVGTLAKTVKVTLTGVAGTGQVGVPAVHTFAGVQATGAVGALAPSVTILLAGLTDNASVGTLTPTVITTLTGVSATGSVGVPFANLGPNLLGITGTLGTPSLIPTVAANITGVSASGMVGSIPGAFTPIPGVTATGSAGTLKASVSATIEGVQGNGSCGGEDGWLVALIEP